MRKILDTTQCKETAQIVNNDWRFSSGQNWRFSPGPEWRFSPGANTAKERTMLHAVETGKIQAGEAGLRGLRKELEQIFGVAVDISIIRENGPFDNPPFIPINNQ